MSERAGIDQDQLDRLFTAALETAIALIEKNGEFFPILFELRPEGAIQAVAVLERSDRPGSQEVIDSFVEILRPRARAGELLASAIGLDTRLKATEERSAGDAVCVRIRAAGYARDVFAPYTITKSGFLGRKRSIELGEIFATEAANEVLG